MSVDYLRGLGVPIVTFVDCEAVVAMGDIDPVTSSLSSHGSTAEPVVDVAALLKIGPVSENAARAASNASSGGPKGHRARMARETLNILEAGGYCGPTGEWTDFSQALMTAIEGSVYLGTREWRPLVSSTGQFSTSVDVRCCNVLTAAQELATSQDPIMKVGVLNFASARNPGGGFSTGAEAQEECIARSSGIYPCLTKHFKAFFVPSRRCPSGAYTHDIIYSPQVPVIRDMRGQLLEQFYLVDFATAAAPNRGCMLRSGTVTDVEVALRERAMRVLASFVEKGVVDIVLGAWGCGVFKNDPKTVAGIFKELLHSRFKGSFRHVLFAVLDPKMAQVFESVFGVSSADHASENGYAGCDTVTIGRAAAVATTVVTGFERKNRRSKNTEGHGGYA